MAFLATWRLQVVDEPSGGGGLSQRRRRLNGLSLL